MSVAMFLYIYPALVSFKTCKEVQEFIDMSELKQAIKEEMKKEWEKHEKKVKFVVVNNSGEKTIKRIHGKEKAA